jgi:hypothetical protein
MNKKKKKLLKKKKKIQKLSKFFAVWNEKYFVFVVIKKKIIIFLLAFIKNNWIYLPKYCIYLKFILKFWFKLNRLSTKINFWFNFKLKFRFQIKILNFIWKILKNLLNFYKKMYL